MGLFRRSPEQRAKPPKPSTSPGLADVDFATTPGAPTANSAPTIADAFACVRALADAAASVPLIAYRRQNDGARARMTSGRLVSLLDRPSPARTQSSLVGSIVAHLNLHGNAYIGKFRDRSGSIEQLDLLPPDRVQVGLKRGEPVYVYSPPDTARQIELSNADLIHVKGLSTDGLVGLSPVRVSRTVLSLSDKLARHAHAFFDNDASPRGVLKLQRFGDVDKQVRELRDSWEQRHRGTESSHRIAVLSGDVDFEAIGMKPDDAQFLQQRKLSAVEVARIFRVPPWMIGAETGDSMTYANVESQALAFVTYSLRPWLVAIEQAVSVDADLAAGNVYVEFLLDSILRADSLSRAEVYTRALDPVTGWMSRDEVRQRENLEPEPSTPAPAASTPVVAPASATASTNGAG